MEKPKCFICSKELDASVVLPKNASEEEIINEIRSCPDGAIVFIGGSNFGSEVADAMVTGYEYEIYICDKCFTQKKKNAQKIHQYTAYKKTYID